MLVLYVMTSFSLAYFAPWYSLNGTTGLMGAFEAQGEMKEICGRSAGDHLPGGDIIRIIETCVHTV